MTSSPDLECSWCGKLFERPHLRGPIPRYCSRSHRQRAYEARRRERAGSNRLAAASLAQVSDIAKAFTRPAFQSHVGDITKAFTAPAFQSQISEIAKAFTVPAFQSHVSEIAKAFTRPAFQSHVGDIAKAFTAPAFQSQISEAFKELSAPAFHSELLQQLRALSIPDFAVQLRDQLNAIAIVGAWQYDPKDVENSLVQLVQADASTPSATLCDEAASRLPLGALAASLLAVLVANPPLRDAVLQLGQDAIHTVSFLLALTSGVHEASAEVRGLVLLLTIGAALVAIRDGLSRR